MHKHEKQIFLLLTVVLLINPWFIGFWGYFHAIHKWRSDHGQNLGFAADCITSVWIIAAAICLWVEKRPLGKIFKDSALFAGVNAVALYLMMLVFNPFYAGKLQILRLGFPIMILWLLARAYKLHFRMGDLGKWRLRLRPVAMILWIALSLVMILEGVFMFVARTNQNSDALASQVWLARHWQLNRFKYREAELDEVTPQPKPQLVMIGDDILAGYGVQDPHRRFSDQLQQQIGDVWQVHNHGENGVSRFGPAMQIVDRQSNILAKYDSSLFHPSLVVLCLNLDDIEEEIELADYEAGNGSRKKERPAAISISQGSYFANYLLSPSADRVARAQERSWLKGGYADPEIVRSYVRFQLNVLRYRASQMHARFAVVLFPMLDAVAESDFAIRPMRDYWASQGVPCLDLTPIYAHYAPEELVVNSSDAHPNEFAHKLAADAIYAFLDVHHLLDD